MSFNPLLREADALFELAAGLPLERFEIAALRRLGQIVGFNGTVWGEGHLVGPRSAVRIDRATLVDRPDGLVQSYASIAVQDPFTKCFLKSPWTPVSDSVLRPRHFHIPKAERDLLLAYDIGHLILSGRPREGPTVRWLTVYRSVKDESFSSHDIRLLWSLVPLWNQAWEVCRTREHSLTAQPVAGQVAHQTCGSNSEPTLTQRQSSVLAELKLGFKYAEIASRMSLSVDTVRYHVREIYKKLGARNRTEALLVAKGAKQQQQQQQHRSP